MPKALITGPTSGFGKWLSEFLLSKSYELLLVGRNSDALHQLYGSDQRCSIYVTDLADLDSLKEAVRQIREEGPVIDLLINNAGILGYETPKVNQELEETFLVNYLSHYYLISELIPLFNPTETVVANICSASVFWYQLDKNDLQSVKHYQPMKAYGRSKRMLMMLGVWVNSNPAFSNIKICNIDPGTFGSGISRSRGAFFQWLYAIAKPFMKTAERAAREVVDLILQKAEMPFGSLIKSGRVKKAAFDEELLHFLIEESTRLSGTDICRFNALTQ